MMPAEHQAAHQAGKSMKTLGIERLAALSGAFRGCRRLIPASGALVPATLLRRLMAP